MNRMSNAVSVTTRGSITVVTLNRPDVRNAVNADTAKLLHDAFVSFDEDPNLRVAVFHGAHGHFCAGWDLQAGARLAEQGVSTSDAFSGLNFSPADYAQAGSRSAGPQGPMGPRA